MDYVKLERALRNLSDSLPSSPQWAALSTIEGNCLRQYPTLLDGDTIAILTHANQSQVQHMLGEIGSGAFRYSINSAQDGIYIVVLLADAYLLGLNFKQVGSLDALIKAIYDNMPPLVAELGAP